MAFRDVPRRKAVFSLATAVLILGAGTSLLIHGGEVPAAQAQSTARPVGTIKTVSGNTITLTTDAGTDVTILVQRSEEHTSELQSQSNLVCRLLLEKKKMTVTRYACTTMLSDPILTYPAAPRSAHYG